MRPETANSEATQVQLSGLNHDQLVDILMHKTQLLLAAIHARLPDKTYIITLSQELENIQKEINSRKE